MTVVSVSGDSVPSELKAIVPHLCAILLAGCPTLLSARSAGDSVPGESVTASRQDIQMESLNQLIESLVPVTDEAYAILQALPSVARLGA